MSSSGTQGEGAGSDGVAPSAGWGDAIVRAAILLILSFVGFVIVPDRMQAYLSLHVVPRTRDGLVLLWVMAFFLFMCWMFVRLQRREWG